MPLALAVLVALFAVQFRGSSKVGALFGPVMLLWFLVAGALGLAGVVRYPLVLQALNPRWGLSFLAHNPRQGFFALGAVFLAVTGAEALYADMGHFGARPIRLAWFTLVLPALILNYLGQGAVLLSKTGAVQHPFFALAPSWALYPLIGLATVAAIIASQAVITSAFSLTRQAVQLDVLPRMNIHQTSAEAYGQIYVPLVNWLLLLATVGLVMGFGNSGSLAGAYGIAVSANMVITTILVLFLRQVFGRAVWWVVPCACGFLVIDSAFFLSNGIKIAYGGWYPLLVAAALVIIMTTWRRGRQLLRERLQPASEPLQDFIQRLQQQPPVRVPGIAVFLTATPPWTPPMLQHHLEHNRALQEQVILLTVQVEGVPRIPASRRLEWQPFGLGVHSVLLRYGFNQPVNVPLALRLAEEVYGVELDLDSITYYVGRETMIPSAQRPGMALWREHLFAFLARNAISAAAYYGIPPEQVVELGIQVEL
jgi:KUP system potassium uptake protein